MELKQVLLNDEAKKYIQEESQGNSITITIINTRSGWAPILEPSVKMGKPNYHKGFKLFKYNGIDVYVSDELKPKEDKIEISLGKFLWRKHIKVEGVSIV